MQTTRPRLALSLSLSTAVFCVAALSCSSATPPPAANAITRVSAGYGLGDYICALTHSGAVHCRQLSRPEIYTPITEGALQISSLSSDTDSGCARMADGTLRCWLDASYEPAIQHWVVDTAPYQNVTDLAGGLLYGCLRFGVERWECTVHSIRGDGTIEWQPIGRPFGTFPGAARAVTCSDVATTTVLYGSGDATYEFASARVVFSPHVRLVDGIPYRACAVFENDTMRCWSSGSAPTATVDSAAPIGLVDLSVGVGHICGRVADHTVRCWGENEDGQLGDGTTTAHAVDSPVTPSGLGPVDQVVAMSARSTSRDASCAVRRGEVLCWGRWPDVLDGPAVIHSSPVRVVFE